MADLVERAGEVTELADLVYAGNNVRLAAPRRYGKTSLLRAASERPEREGFAVVYVDFFAGSHVGMMRQLFGDRRPAFYAQARPVQLPPLPAEELGDWIGSRSAGAGKDVGTAIGPLLEAAASTAPGGSGGSGIPTGTLTYQGNAVTTVDALSPQSVAWNPSGSLLAVANTSNPLASNSGADTLGTFSVAGNGTLTRKDTFTVGSNGGRGEGPGRAAGRRPPARLAGDGRPPADRGAGRARSAWRRCSPSRCAGRGAGDSVCVGWSLP